MSLTLERYVSDKLPNPGAGGDRGDVEESAFQGSAPVLSVAPQISKIMQDILECIQTLKLGFSEDGVPIDDNNQTIHRMCAKLECLLQVDMKERKTLIGKKKDYWEYFCECLTPLKGVNDGIKYVKTTGDCKTSLGKGRAFVRFCLMHHRLADSLQACCTNGKVTSSWYLPKSVWMQHDKSSVIISALYDLNDLKFDLVPRGYDLDNSWPSFARTSMENQHSWALSERARTMSISSLNSVGPDTPSRTATVSHLSDHSDIDHLTQELVISENVRSECEDRIEALEQQKIVFQQSVAESRGEVNVLETQLRQVQTEHRELQVAYKELEKKFDKLSLETDVKEKGNRTHDAELVSKSNELKNENKELLLKIAAVVEALRVVQESLQITIVERDTAKSVVNSLESQVCELQNTMQVQEGDLLKKIQSVEKENSDLLDQLQGFKEKIESSQKNFDEVEAKLTEQTLVGVNLEKTLSSMTAGYQWIKNVKDMAEYREIPGLDSTLAVILKDVSYFVLDLSQKFLMALDKNERLTEENKSLISQNSDLQQDSSVSKEKLLTMEMFVNKMQETEEHLRQKVNALEDRLVCEDKNLKVLSEECNRNEKLLSELQVLYSDSEKCKEKLTYKLELKENEIEQVQEELMIYRSKLEKTEDLYNQVNKALAELMEKLTLQDCIINDTNEKLLTISLQNKQHIEEKDSLKREKELLQSSLKEQQNHNDKNECQLKELREVIEKAQDERQLLHTQKDNIQLEMSNVNVNLNEIKKQNADLSERLNTEQHYSIKFKDHVESLLKEKSLIQEAFEKEKDALMKELHLTQKVNEKLEKECNTLIQSKDSLEEGILKLNENETKLKERPDSLEKELNLKNVTVISLEKDLSLMTKECSNIEAENTRLKTEVKDIQDKYHEKHCEVLLLKDNVERNHEEMERTKKFYEAAENAKCDLSSRFKSLEDNLNEKDAKISNLMEIETSLLIENSKIVRDKEDLRKDLEQLQNDVEFLKNGCKDKDGYIEELKVTVRNLNIEKSSLVSKHEDYEKQITDKKVQFEKLQIQFKDIVIERNNLEQTIRDISLQEAQTTKVNKQLEQKVCSLKQKKKEMQQTMEQKDFDAVSKEKEKLEERLSGLEQEAIANVSEIEKLRVECKKILQEKENIFEENLEKEQHLRSEIQKYEKLKAELDVLSSDKYALEEKIENLVITIRQNIKEMDDIKADTTHLISEKCVLEEYQKEVKEENVKKWNEIASLLEQKNMLIEDNENLLVKFTESEALKNDLLLQMDALTSKFESSKMLMQNKEFEIDQLSAKYSCLISEIDQLKIEKSQIEKNKQKMADDILVLQEKESNNVDTIQKLEESIQKLELEKEGMQGNLSMKMVEIHELQARYNDFQSENGCLVQEYDLLQQTFNDLKETEEVVRSKLVEMTINRDEVIDQKKFFHDKAKNLEYLLDSMSKERDISEHEKDEMQSQVKVLRVNIEENQKELEELRINLTNTMDLKEKLEIQVQDLKSETNLQCSNIESLKYDLDQNRTKLIDRENEILRLDNLSAAHLNTIHRNDARILELETLLKENHQFMEEMKENVKRQEYKLQEKCDHIMHLEEKEKEYKDHVQSLDIKKDTLNNLVSEKLNLIQNLEHHQKELHNAVSELEHDKEQMIIDIKTHQQVNEILQTRSSDSTTSISALNGEIELLKMQHAKNTDMLESKVIELKSIISEVNEQNDHQKTNLKDLTETLKANEDELSNKQELIMQLQQRLLHVKTEKQQIEGNYRDLDRLFNELKKKMVESEGDRNICENELKHTTAELQSKKNELLKNLEDAVTDLQSIKEQLNETSSELEHAYEQKDTVEKQLEELSYKKNLMEQELEISKNKCKTFENAIVNVESQMEEMKRIISELKIANQELELKNKNLTNVNMQLIDSYEIKIQTLTVENNNQKDFINKIRKNAIETTENVKELEMISEDKYKLESEIAELKSQVNYKDCFLLQMNKINRDLREENMQVYEKLQLFESELEKKETEIARPESQVVDVRLISDLSKENDTLKEQKEFCIQNEATNTAQITVLMEQNQKLLDENVTLKNTNQQYLSEIEHKTQKIKDIKDKCKELKNKLESSEVYTSTKAQESELEIELKQEIQTLQFQLSAVQLECENIQKPLHYEMESNEMSYKVLEQETLIDQLHQELNGLQEIANKYLLQEQQVQDLKEQLEAANIDRDSLQNRLDMVQQDCLQEENEYKIFKSIMDLEKIKNEELLHGKDKEILQLTEDLAVLKKQLLKLLKEKDSLWQKTDMLTFQKKLQATVKWMDDNTVKLCIGCQTEFSFTLRKHHCRLCGQIFCNNCSSNWLHTASSSKKSRACNECYAQYIATLHLDSSQSLITNESDDETDIPQAVVIGKTQSDISMVSNIESLASGSITYDTTDGPSSMNTSLEDPYDLDDSKAVGDNETDEDKLKDSVAVNKSNGSEGNGQDSDDQFHVVSDEEIRLSFSLSVEAPVESLGPNISSNMCISLEDLKQGTVNPLTEFLIKPGRMFAVPVEIKEHNLIFGWKFTSSPKDIVFSVNYRTRLDVPISYSDKLVPPCKCDSHKQTTKGELTANQPGVYTLLFDNTYSKITSKKINLELIVDPPGFD